MNETLTDRQIDVATKMTWFNWLKLKGYDINDTIVKEKYEVFQDAFLMGMIFYNKFLNEKLKTL